LYEFKSSNSEKRTSNEQCSGENYSFKIGKKKIFGEIIFFNSQNVYTFKNQIQAYAYKIIIDDVNTRRKICTDNIWNIVL